MYDDDDGDDCVAVRSTVFSQMLIMDRIYRRFLLVLLYQVEIVVKGSQIPRYE